MPPIDREALERALVLAREHDKALRQLIDDKLCREPWLERRARYSPTTEEDRG